MKVTLATLPALALKSAERRNFYPPGNNLKGVFDHLRKEVDEAEREAKFHWIGLLSATWLGLDGKPQGLPSELADIVLIVNSLAGYLQIDLEAAIKMKLEYNNRRTE